MLVLAHISDLHLDGTRRATERAERVRERLWELPGRVDALLVTGDIADHGTEAEYEEAARLLGLRDGEPPSPYSPARATTTAERPTARPCSGSPRPRGRSTASTSSTTPPS